MMKQDDDLVQGDEGWWMLVKAAPNEDGRSLVAFVRCAPAEGSRRILLALCSRCNGARIGMVVGMVIDGSCLVNGYYSHCTLATVDGSGWLVVG